MYIIHRVNRTVNIKIEKVNITVYMTNHDIALGCIILNVYQKPQDGRDLYTVQYRDLST